ncbi:hypothetical protein PAMP_010636 [Pampus punctatissimus]
MCSVLSPGSVLLSANGSLAFKSCARYEDVASFTAPEVQQGHAASTRTAAEKPVQMSAELEGLLLSMCEDIVVRRTDLVTVLETCELHHKTLMLPPAERLVRQLVEDVYRNSVDHVSMAENGSQLTDRSQMIRDRLHRGSFSNSTCVLKKKISKTFSGASYPSEHIGIPSGGRRRESYGSWQQLNRSPCSPYTDGSRHANRSIAQFESTMSLNEKKIKDMGPEFIRMLDEPLVVLELPGSIVSKKGKSATTQRELSVVMPNSQSILVKCEVKSRGGDVFDMIVAHSNLMEHFYFGLAYIDDNEFFFVDNDTKISKVAPDSWKKVPTTTFVLFFRVKFFVSDISLLLHKQTRHQYYLQLRRDLLEDRLSCHEETALYLGALALQTEYGDCMPEVVLTKCTVVYGRNYYRPDQYVSKNMMEKRALPYIQGKLLRLHTNNAQMLADESELEFLKVCQQLPEYGVLFHRVTREKKPLEGEIILGVCAKGVIIYEMKGGCRSTSQSFYWRETATISSNRRKFIIESRGSKKKYTFITERSRIAKYLCNLCSSQHKFNNEMNSRKLSHSLVSEENIVQYATVCRAQTSRLRSYSCSETPQDDSSLTTPQDESLNKLCDDVTARIEARIKQQCQSLNEHSTCSSSQRSSTGMRSPACSQRSGSEAPSSSPAARGRHIEGNRGIKEGSPSIGNIFCVHPGIVIVGEDTVGRYDLGIFVASIVPGGPADKDGQIRPGGRLISLNHISLEGVTFSEAAEVMQSSPEEVQLIISQPKASVPVSPNSVRSPVLRNHESHTTLMTDGRSGDENLDELVSVMMTPKTSNRLHVPREARVLSAQDSCSQSPSMNCVRSDEITVALKKLSGSLGISITGGVNTNLPNGGIYIKSLVPGGAAERDGRVHTDDRLLEVDGISFQGFTYQQAVECLSKTGEVVTLVVERESMNLPRVSLSADTGNISPPTSKLRLNSSSSISTPAQTVPDRPMDYSFATNENTQEVTLTKSANGLGFSFLMCELDPPTRDFGSLIRIKQLFPGQPAQQSGRIQEGDVLLAINGQSLKELSYPLRMDDLMHSMHRLLQGGLELESGMDARIQAYKTHNAS